MAGPATSTTSAKIDDEQRGIVREAHLGQKRNLFWRGPGDTSSGRGASEPGAAGEGEVDIITGADRRPAPEVAISDLDRGLAAPAIETATSGAADPRVPDPTGRYVDDFFEAIYDIDDADKPGHLSTQLTVVYGDGTRIRIDFDEIGDEDFARLSPPFFVVGRGGRTFPTVMNLGTVHNLWAVKQSAQIVIEEYNADFGLIMDMTMVALSFIFPPPTAGLPWSYRVAASGPRPASHAAFDRIDAFLNRLNRRLGRPHIPEDLDPPLQPRPRPQPKAPYAILPDGTEVPPDHHGTVYHGNDGISPKDVVREGGIPGKPFGEDRRLFDHTGSGRGSAFRGGTPFLRAPQRGVQGAAEWAVYDSDVGWVYKIEGAPVWELGKHLEGRIRGPLPGYPGGPRVGTSGEVESVIESRVPIRFITEVFRVTRIDQVTIRVERLDWGRIQATTKTSDVPSSL